MGSEVRPQADFIKKTIVWPILTSTGLKKTFVKLTVSEFLWGYEDELACLDTTSPSDNYENFDDLFSSFDNDNFFSPNEEIVKKSGFGAKKQRNFRQPNGKCIFGALAEKNNTWETDVTMMTGNSGLTDKGRILNIGGSSIFDIWQKDSFCDRLSGTREPSALPPVKNMEHFDMLMGIMCRSIKMEKIKSVEYSSRVNAQRFIMAPDTLQSNSDSNRCYDPELDLPPGIMSVAKCCQGSPLAVSLPHFLHGDKWYRDQVDGIPPPNSTLHELYIDLEPHLGALVGVQARFQLNLVVRPDPAFPPLANLSDPVTVIPIFWAQEGYNHLTPASMQKLNLALMLPNLFADGVIIICVVIGVLLIVWPLLQGAKSILAEQKLCKYDFGSKIITIPAQQDMVKPALYNPLPIRDEDDSQL